MAIAKGKSKLLPSLRRSAGAMFTVMSARGKRMLLYWMADEMRSRPSRTASSPRPVKWYNMPFTRFTSTVTVVTFSPFTAAQ